jgi:E3 ubiquitin-protein ligase UBR2
LACAFWRKSAALTFNRPNKSVKFIERSKEFNILAQLEQLVGNQRIDSHKELLQWVIQKWKSLTGESRQSESVATGAASESSATSEAAGLSEEKKKKAAMAAARRAKIMAQMQSAQKNFMKENSQLFEETPSGIDRQRTESSCRDEETSATKSVCLGTTKSPPVTNPSSFTCILCQEDETLYAEGPSLVIAAFVQKSTVLSRQRYSEESGEEPRASEPPPQYTSCPILLADMPCSPYTSSCGHIMHSACWQKFYDDIVSHERQRSARLRHPHSFDVERQEFLCPLCRRLSNAVIPMIPQFHVLQPGCNVDKQAMEVDTERQSALDMDFSEWIQALLIAIKYKRELTDAAEESLGGADLKSEAAEGGSSSSSSSSTVSQDAVSADLLALQKKAEQLPLPANSQQATRKRYYTCPLDQVVQELDQLHHDSKAYARLYTDHEGHELQFSPSVFEMMNLFSQAVFRNTIDTVPDLHDERIPLMVWQTCAFTIHSIVRSIVDEGKSIFEKESSRQNDCLSTLVRFCGVVGSNFGEPKVIRSHSLKLLSTLLEVDASNLCVLEFDAFGLLVALTFSLPSLFNINQAAPLPSANIQDKHIFHLVYILHLVQILLTTDQFSIDDEEDEEQSRETLPILDLLQLVRETVGFASESDGSEGLRAPNVWKDVRNASLPFLRCSALFYNLLSSIPFPKNTTSHDEEEYSVLMQYLGLPESPSQLCQSPHLVGLARRWANHPNVHIMLSPAAKTLPVSYPLKTRSLVALPQDYSELINSLSSFTCPKSIADDSRVPAMCLVCGQIMCSQSYCCQTTLDGEQVGACTAHAEICGAGNGMFLRVRECKIVLLSGRKKGCFIPPPYLDEYGEIDLNLRRGNPLKLCPARLHKIHKIWLNHRIPEEIAHAVESNLLHLATPWHHL